MQTLQFYLQFWGIFLEYKVARDSLIKITNFHFQVSNKKRDLKIRKQREKEKEKIWNENDRRRRQREKYIDGEKKIQIEGIRCRQRDRLGEGKRTTNDRQRQRKIRKTD